MLELLVVIFIISTLFAILTPAVQKARRHANRILSANNVREVVRGVTLYAGDNHDKFPDSIAKIGFGGVWNWSEPTLINGYYARSPHRSMSVYLKDYITGSDALMCPNAPDKIRFLEAAWQAGNQWDNPETSVPDDPLSGNYCFYWGYVGYLGPGRLFQGPRTSARRHGESQILMSDYFGYGHWRSSNSYGSCEKLSGGSVTLGTVVSASYWSLPGNLDELDSLGVRPQAGFADGRVESYTAEEVVPMRAILDVATSQPYPDGIGPGVYFVPRSGL